MPNWRCARPNPTFTIANPDGYWDNGASYHLVNTLSLLYDTKPISPPMQVDGVGGRILLSHQGRLKALPTLNNMNCAYYSRDLSTNLISLGYLQRSGATYGADPTRPHSHVIVRLGLAGPILATIPLSTNNLLPIDFVELEKSSRASNRAQRPLKPVPHALISAHHTAEQLRRAEEAEQLHHTRSHPSDDALCADLSHGKIPWCSLTCADIRLNRTLRGPCVHCLAGKMTTPHAPSSNSAPATAPGAVLSFDIHQLPETSPGGFTHSLHVVDEHSGKLDIVGATSKTTLAVSRAVRNLIVEYNTDGHRVRRMHGDAEKINASLAHVIGLLGIALQLSLPGEHARRIERYERTLGERTTATLSALSYYLPAKYTLPLHKSIAHTMNDSICTQSAPSTPYEIIGRPRTIRAPLAFGRCCIVTQHEDKRQTIAHQHNIPLNHVGKVEIGVSMGHDPMSKHTLFLLANGLILPRRIRFILPLTFIPFNWTAKEYHIAQNLSAETHTPSTTSNSLVQLPGIDPTTAIQLLTDQPPEALPQPTLASIRTQVQLHHPRTSPAVPDQPAALPLLQLPIVSDTSELLQPPIPPDIFEPVTSMTTTPASLPPSTSSTTTQQPHVPPPSPSKSTTADVIAQSSTPPPLRASSRSNFGINSKLQLLHTQESELHTKNRAGALLSAAITRKIAAIKQAAIRNKLHVHETRSSHLLSNRRTTVEPSPPPRHRAEISIRKALSTLGEEKTTAGITKEMSKIFDTYKAMKPIAWSDIEPDAVFLRAQMYMKEKLNDTVTGRLAIDGSGQTPDTYKETFAGTSCTTNRCFLTSCALADAAHRGVLHQLEIGDFDVPGAFLQNRLPRSETGSKQLWTLLPKDIPTDCLPSLPPTRKLPNPKPTRVAEIVGSMYGLKQANSIFDKDFAATLASHSFLPVPEDPHTFTKRCPSNPENYLHLNMHVDDGQYFSTSKLLTEELCTLINNRYGPDVPFRPVSEGICGVRLTRHPNHDVTLDMEKHILKSVLPKCGMDEVPPALTPSLPDFFDAPTDATPTDIKTFQSANGCLIHLLPIRYDIRKEVVHLCTRNSAPTRSDRIKQIQVLRYLKGCPSLGITFSANPQHFPNGVVITGSSDSSHACHKDTGQSHSAHILSVGFDNAPFSTYSSAEPSSISVSPCESEYVCLSRLALNAVFFRKYAISLGYPQHNPSVLKQDNKSAISLVQAPELPRRSRHILQRHHVIRFLHSTGQIFPTFEGTHDIIPDGMTKTLGPSAFLYFRHKLMRHPP